LRLASSKCEKNSQNGNNFMISDSKFSILSKPNVLKLKYENVIKMKNKPYPFLLGASFLSDEIKEGHQNLVRLSLYDQKNVE
jgi:hypothetical protein